MSFVLEALQKQEAGRDPDAAVSLARAGLERRRHRLWAALFALAMAVNAALLFWVYGVPRFFPDGTTAAATGAAAADAADQRTADTPTSGSLPGTAVPGTGADAGWSDGESPAAAALPGAVPEPTAASAESGLAAGTAPATRRRSAVAAAPAPAAMPGKPVTRPTAASARDPAEPSATAPAQAPPVAAGPTHVSLADLPAAARGRFPGIAFSTHIYSEDADLRAVVANGHRLKEGDRIRGLPIVEITETGVVLAFENYLVEVPIVVDWDAVSP